MFNMSRYITMGNALFKKKMFEIILRFVSMESRCGSSTSHTAAPLPVAQLPHAVLMKLSNCTAHADPKKCRKDLRIRGTRE